MTEVLPVGDGAGGPHRRRGGRPLGFCPADALEVAMRVFWAKGCSGATITALTAAMGIGRPSLYAEFGSKEALFRRALDHYEATRLAYYDAALSQPTAPLVARALLRRGIDAQTARADPRGCLLVVAARGCGVEAEPFTTEVARRNVALLKRLEARLEKAARVGDLPAGLGHRAVASYVFALRQGLAFEAAAGATRERLKRAADAALARWLAL
jgi:AcrR family transcriptional regulator